MYSHTAEYGKSLDKIFIILREQQIIEFVDELYNADNLSGWIFNRHA